MDFFKDKRFAIKAAAPVIRKEIIRDPPKPTRLPSKTANAKLNSLVERRVGTSARESPSSARSSPSATSQHGSSLRAPATKSKVRRKSPSHARLMTDSESDSPADGAPAKRRKVDSEDTKGKVGPSKRLHDRNRKLRSTENTNGLEMIHAADLASARKKSKARAALVEPVESVVVELQYPGAPQRERYDLVLTKDKIDPYTEIIDIAQIVRDVYLTAKQAEVFNEPNQGIIRKLERSRNLIWNLPSRPDPELLVKLRDGFKDAVHGYNSTLEGLVKSGALAAKLDSMKSLPLNMIVRILVQVYERCVSPTIETLKRTGESKDNTYGELLHPFVSRVLKEARLKSDHVFIDLGSGVGNVVFQAALEFGCESWGCEMMENACSMAEAQEKEFKARCRLWGIKSGDIHLERGDFMENQPIHKAMKRADVILVNNEVFSPALNEKLINLFLDLKDGCRIISLKSFVNSKISDRTYSNPSNLLDVKEGEYHSGSVNWTSAGGKYYIATKNEQRLAAYADQEYSSHSS